MIGFQNRAPKVQKLIFTKNNVPSFTLKKVILNGGPFAKSEAPDSLRSQNKAENGLYSQF